jgi:predicted nucleic acid-binding protein
MFRRRGVLGSGHATYPNLNWGELSLDVADRAALIRAQYGLKTPDAIQMATAVCSGATAFLCNDPAFQRVKEMNCLLLDDCFRTPEA